MSWAHCGGKGGVHWASTLSMWVLLGMAGWAWGAFPMTPGGRCDLRSGSLSGGSACLPVDSLSGAILNVPGAVTRISTDGFVVCGSQVASDSGTDIVYVVDQSGSMQASSILPRGKDTLVYSDCIFGTTPMLYFHGSRVLTVDSTQIPNALASCIAANDPYSRRASVVQGAVSYQATLSKGSYAGWVSFGDKFHASMMYDLAIPSRLSTLTNLIQLERLGGTNYKSPIGWARAMLQGAHQTANSAVKMPASPNRKKAIIMISDGEPTDQFTYLDAIAPNAQIADTTGLSWTIDATTSPSIYGIFLSSSPRSGKALQDLAQQTGGQFVVIPPNDPDSLKRMMASIVGGLFQTANPDSFRITNKTNGQVSTAISSAPEGGGSRMRLDSIVGLSKGRNDLEIRATIGTSSAKTIQWTVVVGDSGSQFSASGTDSVLMASCMDPSRLFLRPGSDTTRAFADSRDSTLVLSWNVSNAGQSVLPTSFSASVSRDAGSLNQAVPASPTVPRLAAGSPLRWTSGVALVGDRIVQTGFGWDTVKAIYRTPRDPRDSAAAILPVLHPRSARLWIAPDTSKGIRGQFLVNLLDSLQVPDTAVVIVTHRLGDSVKLVLRRSSGALFTASVSFVQGVAPYRGDAVLQTGTLRPARFDSVFAIRNDLRDTAILAGVTPKLRFMDALGHPGDSLGATMLDPGGSLRLRVGSFLGDSLLALSDSLSVSLPSWLGGSVGIRLSGGVADLVVHANGTGTGGYVVFRDLDRIDSLIGGPLTVSAFRLVFVDASGAQSSSWPVDRALGETEIVKVRVVGKDGICTRCGGMLRVVPLTQGLQVATQAKVVAGEAVISLGADRPVEGGKVVVAYDTFSLSLEVSPVRFGVPAPDSVVYQDRDGDGGVDHLRVYLKGRWNPLNVFVFPWPSAGSNIDLSQAVYSASADSLTLDISLSYSQRIGTTTWSGSPISATWAWSTSDSPRPFPAIDRIAPVPTRARILRGATFDTLVVTVSEPIQSSRVWAGANLLRKVSPVLGAIPAAQVTWDSVVRNMRLVYASTVIDGVVQVGDSVRLPESGDVTDYFGTSPGRSARAVVVEGLDRAPYSAVVTDSDADGRADMIILRFSTAPRWADRYVFRWPDGNGGADFRVLHAASAVADSGGRILSFALDPFRFGVTSCPINGCSGFGSMSSGLFGDTIRASFDEQDGVNPVIVQAILRFGSAPGIPDTLKASLSESVDLTTGADWVRWGRPSIDSLGASVKCLAAPSRLGQEIVYLVDSSFAGGSSDSIRLGAWPEGGVSDVVGNRPGRFAHWTQIELGDVPGRLVAMPWPSLVKRDGWIVPPDEEPLNIFVRPTSRDPWRKMDGSLPSQDLSHYLGLRIISNTDLEAAKVYIYDNLGVFVAHIDLSTVLTLLRTGGIDKTRRGDFEILVAWNGKDSRGAMVPNGVYVARLVAWEKMDLGTTMINRIYKLGWFVPAPR